MKWKPIRRAQGDYEKMMKFMKFHQSDDHYEVHDPDLLRMKKQNESLKSALNEANQSVKQIQTLFETQTVIISTNLSSLFYRAKILNETHT